MKNLDEIKDVLARIKDADLGVTLKELDGLKNVSLQDNNKLKIELSLPGPITYLKKDYEKIITTNFSEANTPVEFSLEITEKKYKDEEALDEKRPSKLKNIKHIIAISSGKGGVGKSTISANIAVELANQGAKVGILDADIYGPSQTVMFGIEGEVMEASTDQHGNTTAFPIEKHGVKIASIGSVLNRSDVAALRGPMLSRILNLFCEQIEWGELDYLVFDLPPGTGDVHLTFAQQICPDGVVLITTPQEISLADVRRGAALFKKLNVAILGVVENMSYFIPPDMPDKKYYIFGEGGGREIAVELDLLLLGEIPFSVMMREMSDSGKPIVLQDSKNFQKEILKDITANIISELRRKEYSKANA